LYLDMLPRGISHNDWLRQQNLSSRDTLQRTMAKLRVVLQELEFQYSQGITMEPSREFRIEVVATHLIAEIHLSDTLREAD